jgi:hypothetical protein
MTGKATHFKKNYLRAMAAVVVVLSAGLIPAPARADHDDGPNVGFHFFFGGFPPPPVYYYEPAPRVVIQERPYYRDWNYQERDYREDNWRGHHHNRHHSHHDAN